MTDFEQLSDKLQKLCEPRETKHGKLDNSLVAVVDNEMFFLTNVFKNGKFLGFWSHSPWGTCHNQEEGWVVLSPELEILGMCETKISGRSAGNGFMEWRKQMTLEHGKSFKLIPEWGGDQFWKITDC